VIIINLIVAFINLILLLYVDYEKLEMAALTEMLGIICECNFMTLNFNLTQKFSLHDKDSR